MNLGNKHIILGLPWLRSTNAAIDWQSGEITLPGAILLNRLPDQPTTTAEQSSEMELPLPPTQLLSPDNEEDYGDPLLELEPDETLIAYLQGEPILGVFETETLAAIRAIPAQQPDLIWPSLELQYSYPALRSRAAHRPDSRPSTCSSRCF